MSNPPPTPSPHPSPPANSPKQMIGIIVGSAVIGSVVLVVGSLLGLARGDQQLAIGPTDRVALITAGDFTSVFPDLVIRTNGETVSKVKKRRGPIILTYHYAHPNDDATLRIDCLIYVAQDAERAEEHYTELVAAAHDSVADYGSDVKFVADNFMPRWGDQSRFGTLNRGGRTVGAWMTGLQGERSFAVRFMTDDISISDSVAVIERFLSAVVSYEP